MQDNNAAPDTIRALRGLRARAQDAWAECEPCDATAAAEAAAIDEWDYAIEWVLACEDGLAVLCLLRARDIAKERGDACAEEEALKLFPSVAIEELE